MANLKIEELTKDLEELSLILPTLTRQKNIDALTTQKAAIEREIVATKREVERLERVAQNRASASSEAPKRFEFELTNYAWDQSDKFIKIFLSLDGVQNTTEENVIVEFTDKSITSKIAGVDNKDYKFAVNNLLFAIDVEKSYRKIKTNAIAIYAKKLEEKKSWSHLTSTEKRLADIKNSAMSDIDTDTDKSDPSSGLMNIMKKMYETGDPEMKKMISKAWTEGQEKKLSGGGGGGVGGMDGPF